jgi:RNA polymerase sigma-70 factor (ECF subfamily)
MNQFRETMITTASLKTCADSELVDRFRLGEAAAFDEIDYRYRKLIYRFLLRFNSDSESAEELTQCTLIRAFEMMGQLKCGDKLAGWLHRIAFRLAVSARRCKKTVPLDGLGKPFAQPINQIDLEEEKQNVWSRAEKYLSADEYMVLLFRYRDNLTLSEIAGQTGKSESYVRVQLHRARKKLQVLL